MDSSRSADGGLGHKSGRGVNGPALQNAGRRASARQRDPIIGGPHQPVLDHRIAAAMFGGIESGVGGLDQVA